MSQSKKLLVQNTNKSFIMNRVIWLLTISDIFTWGVYLIISGFVGLYLSEKLKYDPIEVLGLGTAIFYIGKGLFQIPIGIVTDKIQKDKDDILFLICGNLLMGTPYLFFPLISQSWHYFILQFLIGLGGAMNLVNWRKIFARNLDEGKEGLDYAVYDTIMSFVMIFFSVLAGFIANKGQNYFDLIMFVVGIFMLLSTFSVVGIYFTKNRKTG